MGTNVVTGHPDGALDGVYKLTYYKDKARIKLSENIQKMTLPNHKQVYRMTDKQGRFIGADVIALADEAIPSTMAHPYEPFKSMDLSQLTATALQSTVMTNGQQSYDRMNISDIAHYVQTQMNLLPMDYRRFDNPHQYKVGISSSLKQQRNQLIKELRS